MIYWFEVKNDRNERLKVDLFDPSTSGFIVKSIEGLTPAKAVINNTELATSDGAINNSTKIGTRNIVLNLLFDLDHNAEDLRLDTYRYFPIKRKVTLWFKTENRKGYISGIVESNEPDIFSKWEGTQISILCPYPFFYGLDEDTGKSITSTEFTSSKFEFPFSNPSLTNRLIEFGLIKNDCTFEVDYDGDAEIGVTIEVNAANGTVGGVITFTCLDTNETLEFDTGKISDTYSSLANGLLAGDKLTINTSVGNKKATLQRSIDNERKTYNVLNCVSLESVWFSLKKGENKFSFNIGSGVEYARINFKNNILYEGF